jgi:YD repeat-containing protein
MYRNGGDVVNCHQELMEAPAPFYPVSSFTLKGVGIMSDVAKRKLRGPVRTLRTETAEWDAAREAWKPSRHVTVIEFRTDGKIGASDSHYHDGTTSRVLFRYDDRGRLLETQYGPADGPFNKSVYSYDETGRHLRTASVAADGATRESETCRYDSTGRKTKVSFLDARVPNVGVGIEGTDHAFGAPGATTMTTAYGDRDEPEEVVLHDANHAVVRRVTFTRDREGRVLSEVVQFGGQFPFPEMQQQLGKGPAEEVAAMAAVLAQAFEAQTLHSTTYAYDRHGRVLERTERMGTLSETRTTYRYDDRDNPIEEIEEAQNRELGVDADGTPRARNESARRHDRRYEYQYDAEGNWTERIVSGRIEPNAIFQRSALERRQITYYAR